MHLQEYLREAYTRAKKLDITLLPEWAQLHVSEIFSTAILAGDKQLRAYKEIFYKDGKLQNRVVLLGDAGRGKTTFCKHLTDIWLGSTSVSQFCDIDVLKKFDYLFYVSCRFAKEEETILHMIIDQVLGGDDKMTLVRVARYVLQYFPNLCLIIVDGFDEWAGSPTSETGRMGDIAGLPGLAGIEDCVILITSRPWRFNALFQDEQKIFKRLKIDGILNVKELSQQILLKLEDPTPEKSAKEFLRQVEERKMSDLMKIPLILIIALRGWVGDNDDEMVRSLHKSMCINYINMMQSFIRRSKGQAGWSSSESKLRQLVPNLENLEIKWGQKSNELPPVFSHYKDVQRYAGLLLSVGHLAFDLLLETEKQSLVFSKAKVKKYLPADAENDESINACLALGIISKAETTTRGLKKLESYAFCHKTFQEFFAALWLASNYQTEKTKLCINTTDTLQGLEILIRFLCGFDPVLGKDFWIYVTDEVKAGQSVHWEDVQKLACICMAEHEVDTRDQMACQIYFCIPHIMITEFTSDEDIMLLCHVLEEYDNCVKSVEVYYLKSQEQTKNICKSISHGSGLQSLIIASSTRSNVRIPVLDLQKHNKLEKLKLEDIAVECLLLPVEEAAITSLCLYIVTMTHNVLEQLVKSLPSCIHLGELYLNEVKCNEHLDSVCISVLDLRKSNAMMRLELKYISVEGLLLPVEGSTITLLKLNRVTMTHHGLKQMEQSLGSCSSLVEINLNTVRCSEHAADSACIPVLNLQKHNKLKKFEMQYISAEGLLLPAEGATITSLRLDNVTMTHHGLKQLGQSSVSCSSLVEINLNTVRCSEHAADSACISVLYLQKHNKLRKLELHYISVDGMLLPVEGATITSLKLDNVTMTHHGLKQLINALLSSSSPAALNLRTVQCSEHIDSVCIFVMCLQNSHNLKKLELNDICVEHLPLPVECARTTSLYLCNVILSHNCFKQLGGTSFSLLEGLYLKNVECREHGIGVCTPYMDLRKQNILKQLILDNISIEGLLLPEEVFSITSLCLYNLTIPYHSLEKVVKFVSLCPDLEELDVREVKCVGHDDTVCIPVLDLQKHNNLKKLKLDTISAKRLLLPEGEATTTILVLYNLTITLHSLEHVVKFVTLCPGLEKLDVQEVKCVQHDDAVCIPVLDLRKHNNLKSLALKTMSIESLLLPEEGVRITFLQLSSLKITHHGLEQVEKIVRFCPGLEELDVREVKCVEHDTAVCIPVLNLQKHYNFKRLVLDSICFEGLLLPEEGPPVDVTMTHHGLELLMKSLLSNFRPAVVNLLTVKCSEHTGIVCIPVMCLQNSHNLMKLELNDIFVEHLPLPVECARTKSLKLCNAILSHNCLKQLGGTSFSLLEDLHLKNVECSEYGIGVCTLFPDLRKQNNLKQLILDNISIEGLLLPKEVISITSLCLYNLTIPYHSLEQIVKFVTLCPGLQELAVQKVKCVEHDDTVCIPVLDIQKHNNLKTLVLDTISVESLMLPDGETTITLLWLYNLTITHHSLEQVVKFVSLCPGLEELAVQKVKCVEHDDTVCIPVLDIQKHNKLKTLVLDTISVESLMLPDGKTTITLLWLYNLTITHHSLEQVVKFVSLCPGLEELAVRKVKCVEHDDTECIPVLDLQKHNNLKCLVLDTISVESLMLPDGETTITLLWLFNLTITHHSLEQIVKFVSLWPGLEELAVWKVKCVEHDDTVCIPVLDIQKHNKLKTLVLDTISVESLMLPDGKTTITSLWLYNLTITHHSLEQIVKFVSLCPGLEKLGVREVKCAEHNDTVCIPVLDIQKHNKMKTLVLDTISVESLMLPDGKTTITSLWLYNLTITHHSLEPVVKFVSLWPGLEELAVWKVKCVEHDDSVCIPVLDIQKHNKLKTLILDTISVESLVLPLEGATITLLWLYNLTITHHSLEQIVKFVSVCPGLEELAVQKVKCIEHGDTVCLPVLDLQKHNNLKRMVLDTRSVESLLLPKCGVSITSLGLYNLTITHHSMQQVVKFVSLCPGLEKLDVRKVNCVDHDDTVCIPVLDLQKHNILKRLVLDSICFEGLLLPEEGPLIDAEMTHHGLELLMKSLLSSSHPAELNLQRVKCCEHTDSVCIPAMCLQSPHHLTKLELNDIYVEHLPLPVDCTRTTSLKLCNVILSHNGLKQLGETSFSLLDDLHLENVQCREHGIGACIPYLDLRKQTNLKQLVLDNISIEGLLLTEEDVSITSISLCNLTVTHHGLEQVVKFVSFCPGLEKLDVHEVKCVENDDSVCIPVLDLKKQNSLKELILKSICFETLLLPEEEATITSLWLFNLTFTHHSREQIVKFVPFCPGLEELMIKEVKCVEHDGSACIPVLDLQKNINLKRLTLDTISVESLLLPEEEATTTSVVLNNLTITHHILEKVVKFVSLCPGLEKLVVRELKCVEHDTTICIPVLDLQKHNILKRLVLDSICFEGLLLPEEGPRIDVEMTHHGLELLMKSLLSSSRPAELNLQTVKCCEHTDSVCIPAMCLQSPHNLTKLELNDIYVEHLPIPVDCTRTISLKLCKVILSHDGLKQFGETSFSLLDELHLENVQCREHGIGACIPYLDLRKQTNLKQLVLDNISIEGLLLTEDDVSITSISLYNLTVTHHGLEQVVKFVSFCPGLEELDVEKVKCAEHGETVCIPVLDLQKHINLKTLVLNTISVESLLLPLEGATFTSLDLENLIITHHGLEQVVKFVSLCPGLEKLDVWKVKCAEHGETVCIPVLDLQKHINLKTLVLNRISVENLLLPLEGATFTSLGLENLIITHHSLEQVVKFVSLCPGLEELDVWEVKCVEHDDTICIPFLDLRKHNKLKTLVLDSICFEGMLLSLEGGSVTSLWLGNVTMTHHGLEKLMKSLLSSSRPAEFNLITVTCSEHTDSVCIPVTCLLNSHNLTKLDLNDIFVEHLPLPVNCARTTSLKLCNVILSHNGLKQLWETSFSLLEDLHLKNVECKEHGIGVCTPYLDLRKQNNMKQLTLDNISVEGLLLPEESATITSLILYNLRMAYNSLEQVVKFVSFCPGLKELDAQKVKCVEHGDNLCIPVLDLQKHINLKRLILDTISVESLMLPERETTITSLALYNSTIDFNSLEQVEKFVSVCPDLEELEVGEVKCVEHDGTIFILELDLRKNTKLEKLVLHDVYIEGPLLPEEEANITSLELHNIILTHDGLEQMVKFLKSCSSQMKMNLDSVGCREHFDSVCIAVLDLRKHNSQASDTGAEGHIC